MNKLEKVYKIFEKLGIETHPMNRALIRLSSGAVYKRGGTNKKGFIAFNEDTETFLLGNSIDVYAYSISHKVNVLLVFESPKAFDILRVQLDDYRIGRQVYDLRLDVIEMIATRHKCYRPLKKISE